MKAYAGDAIITEDVRSALKEAKTIAKDKDLILITGSFYTVGEAKTIINEIF
jgi:folylpolyglutamate synthase/dihydropteroate synthase